MKVKVCKKCSGIDIDALESFLTDKDVKLKCKCLGKCSLRKFGKPFGKVAGEIVVLDTQDEFFVFIEKTLQEKQAD